MTRPTPNATLVSMATGEEMRLIRERRNQKVLTGSAAYDPASILAGADLSTTVNVAGARVGDPVAAGFSIPVPAGVLLNANVTDVGVVTVTLLNETAVAVDLASGTLKAQVFQGA